MSRIGKKPVSIPKGVDVKISNQNVEVKGKMGTLSHLFSPEIEIRKEGEELLLNLRGHEKKADALWGLSRSLLFNMVKGVSEGFTKVLEIQGVGYRAAVNGRSIQLSLGYSHPVEKALPEGISAKVDKNTVITFTGIDKQQLGQLCAEIREFRPPEPYKGKGIRYLGEHILRKEGKKK
ncbi:MAG: 50S ribosomal protein L6 [Magnetococcales bacterium]|nr:50S ribosomal protein L6 [Magnetococcales bacterium]MBF0149948.1 50S ribosomal protein L6 [Magnetococcales bacterium]MBF0172883.1 50S ribosomal protein L6 [Magnetococcales bacterium]MBF0346722.1 50S ribosomal protein L6 [Magnetococcales bacterium]MBF0630396.1 50S ribosomal protein L6 [Magnetococcales bacterium]